MGSISDYLENKLLDHVMKVASFAVPPNLFIALSTTDPTDAETGITEPPGGAGYARIASNNWEVASGRATENSDQIDFATATSAWGDQSHWAIFDAVTGGNMLAHGAFTVTKSVGTADKAQVLAGEIDISIDSGGSSDYLAHKLLDHVFKVAAFAVPPNLYVAAIITNPVVDADTGSTITEPAPENGYARKQENSNWNAADEGLIDNPSTITFVPATNAGWGMIVDGVIVDAATAGNLLFFGSVAVEKTVPAGDTLEVPAEAFNITMD